MKWFNKLHDVWFCSCEEQIDFYNDPNAMKKVKEHIKLWHVVNREVWFHKEYK